MMTVSRIAMTLLAAALAGCANTPPPETTGTRMAAEAGRSSDRAERKGILSDQWKRGQKMMTEGEKQIAQANNKAHNASRDATKFADRTERAKSDQMKAAASLGEGQAKVAEGQRLKTEAEQQFPFAPAIAP